MWVFLRTGEIEFARAVEPLTSDTTVSVTLNTLALVTGVTVASILIGVPLAILTAQTDLPFKRFWTITSALPLVVPSYIGALAMYPGWSPRWVLRIEVERVVLSNFRLSTACTARYCADAVSYPYVFLTTRASLLSFDGTVVEAARTLNHTRWEAFRRVTLLADRTRYRRWRAAGARMPSLTSAHRRSCGTTCSPGHLRRVRRSPA